MKNIEVKMIPLLLQGYCTPQISVLAKKLREPATTIHYNLKKMEREGKIAAYKTVFHYGKIQRGFCTYVLISIAPEEYGKPERLARELTSFEEIESIDIVTGDWEFIIKIRTKTIEEYYAFLRTVLSRRGIIKIKSINILRQIKTEFIVLP
jgi:DNA-binding Lrp family transcriptional regulator